MNFELLRKRMVEIQLKGRGITDTLVLNAFGKVPRHEFVPAEELENAYSDFPLPIGQNQTISQPYIVALMTELLGLSGKERVLEIGTGSGYQTAILAEIAKEVYTVEKIPELSDSAAKILRGRGYTNIFFRKGDGSLGWPEKSPFDRIIITAYSQEVPAPLVDQLEDKGKLILPLGERFDQMLTLVEKKGKTIIKTAITACVFVPLLGEFGVKDK